MGKKSKGSKSLYVILSKEEELEGRADSDIHLDVDIALRDAKELIGDGYYGALTVYELVPIKGYRSIPQSYEEISFD